MLSIEKEVINSDTMSSGTEYPCPVPPFVWCYAKGNLKCMWDRMRQLCNACKEIHKALYTKHDKLKDLYTLMVTRSVSFSCKR
jgi:hypothetical protein